MLENLFNMQAMLFILIIVGILLYKTGVVTDEGQRCLTDMTLDVIIPCNIITSFMIEMSGEILRKCFSALVVSVVIQIGYTILSHTLYNRYGTEKKKVLQYATVCSNAGFMGNAIAEGLYGSMGLLYAALYLIPVRIVIWSAGVSIFTESPDKKTLIKKVATHPCIVAVYIGMILMISQLSLPEFASSTIQAIGKCNTPMTMIIIGLILAKVDVRTICSWTAVYYTVIRLAVIPLLVFVGCRLFQVDALVTGVSVLLAGMPAGSTTAIFASKYNGDGEFATKIVVFSTILSLVSIPIWCIVCGV